MSELKSNKNFPRATPKTINSQNFIIHPKSILLYALPIWSGISVLFQKLCPGTGLVLFLSTDENLHRISSSNSNNGLLPFYIVYPALLGIIQIRTFEIVSFFRGVSEDQLNCETVS